MYLGWTNVMTCYFVDVIFAVVEVDVKHDSFVEQEAGLILGEVEVQKICFVWGCKA